MTQHSVSPYLKQPLRSEDEARRETCERCDGTGCIAVCDLSGREVDIAPCPVCNPAREEKERQSDGNG